MPIRSLQGVTRRSVLLGALLPVAGVLPDLRPADIGSKDIAGWLREWIPDAGAAAIGVRYLLATPSERSPDRLARELFGRSLSDEADWPGFKRLMRRVQASRARDFLNDDLVLLEGWAVARTEARLLALVALCARR
jgi:hypothetical protein